MSNTRHDDPKTFAQPCTFEQPITPAASQRMIRTWTSGIVPRSSLSAGTSNSINLPAGDDGAFPAGVQVLGANIEVTTAITINGGDTTSCLLGLGVSGSPVAYLATGANLAGTGTGRKENATGNLIGSYRAADTPQLYVTGGGGDPDMADIATFGARVRVFYCSP